MTEHLFAAQNDEEISSTSFYDSNLFAAQFVMRNDGELTVFISPFIIQSDEES